MTGVLRCKNGEQIIKYATLRFVSLVYITRTKQFHNHREVLFFRWSFILQVKNESKQQHRSRRIPKRVVALAAFGCGRLKQICHKSLHIVVALNILERIVSVRAFHIYKVKHSYLISFCFQKSSRVSQYFALRVKNNHRGIRLYGVGFCIVIGLARTATADNKRVHVSSVRSHVVSYTKVLCENLIVFIGRLAILLVQFLHITPFCRAVFLTAAVVWFGIMIHNKNKSVYCREYENARQSFTAPS